MNLVAADLVFKRLHVGLVIVYTLDEVAFIQNLVFYITSAYRTPVSKMFELKFLSFSCFA